MNVGQLQTVLARLPKDVVLELGDGSSIDSVCYNWKEKRLEIDTEDNHVSADNLAEGWIYLEIPK